MVSIERLQKETLSWRPGLIGAMFHLRAFPRVRLLKGRYRRGAHLISRSGEFRVDGGYKKVCLDFTRITSIIVDYCAIRVGHSMSDDVQNLSARAQRTRRNILKMAPILASAVVARSNPAGAAPASICGIPIIKAVSKCNCFLKGTRIQTAEGGREVENLAIGDLLPTKFGGMRPIQWIGRYPRRKSDPAKGWAKDAMPIRIERSALAPGVPNADLYVTERHCLYIDGVLAPAALLINGTTITRFDAREHDVLEYFHVKFETHDVIFAEGVPVETLLIVDESAVNFAEYFRMYGQPRTEMDRCAPLVPVGGQAELTSRLRSAISPWFDRRDQVDVVRDRLEERGALIAL